METNEIRKMLWREDVEWMKSQVMRWQEIEKKVRAGDADEISALKDYLSRALIDNELRSVPIPIMAIPVEAYCSGSTVISDEVARLEQLIEERDSKPVSTREQRTLLTIIAALCDYSAIDHGARGSAQRIKGMTQEIGAPIDDGTIAKVLAKIPDALETRMK